MPTHIEIPDPALVSRCRNLAFGLWAPPDAKALAEAGYLACLSALIAEADSSLLLGFRPHWREVAAASEDVDALAELTSECSPRGDGSPFAILSPAKMQAQIHLIARGTLSTRRHAPGASGLARDRFVHVGTPILVANLDVVVRAYRDLVLAPDVQRHVYVVKNPYAGFAQDHGAALRRAIGSAPDRVHLHWNGNSRAIVVHGSDGMLETLRAEFARLFGEDSH